MTKSGIFFVFPILLVITLTPGGRVHISGWTVCSPGRHVSAALFSQFPLLPVSFSKVRISLKIIVENGRLHERYRRSEDTLGEGKLETLAEWSDIKLGGGGAQRLEGGLLGCERRAVHNLSFLIFWPCIVACGTLVPWPGIELMPPALEAWGLNHWNAREVPI